MPARLLIRAPDAPSRAVVVSDADEVLVGRVAECAVFLDDDRISRRHARLFVTNGTWQLEDLASKNGTLVDGVSVSTARALPGQAWLSFGGLLVYFEIVSDDALLYDNQRQLMRWQTSIEARTRLDPASGVEALLRHLLRSIVEVSGADRGVVVLTGADGALEPAVAIDASGAGMPMEAFSGSTAAVRRALESGQPLIHSDVTVATDLAGQASVVAGSIRGLVCLPLTVVERCIGAVYADSTRPGHAVTELELEIMTAIAAHAALAIAIARLQQEMSALEGVARPPETDPRGWRAARDVLTAVWERALPPYRPSLPVPR